MNPRPRKLQALRWLPPRWVLTRGDVQVGALHLTFDDGPDPEHTPRMLDLLAAHDARATFFLIGARAERHPGLVERIVREGHALGNHSWNHRHFETLTVAEQRGEIERTDALLAGFDGLPRHDFRPPRGRLTGGMVLDCIRRGQRIAYWSYDSLDYSARTPDMLIASARRHPPQAGEIVLLHDDGERSLALLEALLPEWKAAGFAFAPLRPVA